MISLAKALNLLSAIWFFIFIGLLLMLATFAFGDGYHTDDLGDVASWFSTSVLPALSIVAGAWSVNVFRGGPPGKVSLPFVILVGAVSCVYGAILFLIALIDWLRILYADSPSNLFQRVGIFSGIAQGIIGGLLGTLFTSANQKQ